MEKQVILEQQLNELRKTGVISGTEVAYRVGDLLVAEDVVTGAKRVVNEAPGIGKRVLKG